VTQCILCDAINCSIFWQQEDKCYWRCANCESTFLEPKCRLTANEERAYYDLHENHVDDPGYRNFLRKVSEPLLNHLPPKQHGLDYGCGPGPALAAMLGDAGHTVALYDPFYRPNTAVLDKTYDFITCTEVAEHFHRPSQEFYKLHGMLRPGGWLAVMTSLLENHIDFERWHYRRDPTHVVFYRRQTFYWLATRYGWRCEFIDGSVILIQKLKK